MIGKLRTEKTVHGRSRSARYIQNIFGGAPQRLGERSARGADRAQCCQAGQSPDA
jgi:hypothetical protein